jgi:hypothetical protein
MLNQMCRVPADVALIIARQFVGFLTMRKAFSYSPGFTSYFLKTKKDTAMPLWTTAEAELISRRRGPPASLVSVRLACSSVECLPGRNAVPGGLGRGGSVLLLKGIDPHLLLAACAGAFELRFADAGAQQRRFALTPQFSTGSDWALFACADSTPQEF